MNNCKYRPKMGCGMEKCEFDCIINVLSENHFDDFAFKEKGWYEEFQTTDIWKKAKEYIINYKRKEGKLYCDLCKKEIYWSPVLHHLEYDWGNFFHNDYIKIIHKECHEKWHNENELPEWKHLPDKLYDLFKLDPNQDHQLGCWVCNSEYIGRPYQFLCKKCYWESMNRGVKPDWRDYL